jgi:hypothetical protein
VGVAVPSGAGGTTPGSPGRAVTGRGESTGNGIALAAAVARLLVGDGLAGLPVALRLISEECGSAQAALRETLPGRVPGAIHASGRQPMPVPNPSMSLELPIRSGDRLLGLLILTGLPGGESPVDLRWVHETRLEPVLDVLGLALSALQADPARVAGRLLTLQELDGDHVAGLLHDGPLQALVAASYHLQLSGSELAGLDEGLRETITATRRILAGLRARGVGERRASDLVAALEGLAAQVGIPVSVRADDLAPSADDTSAGTVRKPDRNTADKAEADAEVIGPVAALLCFRLAQAWTVAAADRGSPRVTIALTRRDGGLGVHCSDDVVGDIPDTVERWVERVVLLGGRVSRSPRRGLNAWLPLEGGE